MPEIGSSLKAAREKKGITLREVEDATKVRVKYLEALENEDYSILPGRVYAVGFLRSYASYLGLDSDELVKAFNEVLPPQGEEEILMVSPAVHSGQGKKRAAKVWLVLLVLVLAAVVVFALVWQTRLAGISGEESPQPEAGIPENPPVSEITPGGEPPAPGTSPGIGLPAEPQPPAAGPPQAKPVTVEVRVRERECWMEVRVDGRLEYSGILRAGEGQFFSGEQEVRIKFGAAGAVEVLQDGQPVGPMGRPGQVVTWSFTREGAQRVTGTSP